jgi:hypothetical protein
VEGLEVGNDGAEKGALVVEVVVDESRRAQPAFASNALDGRLVVTVASEDAHGGLDDLPAAIGFKVHKVPID